MLEINALLTVFCHSYPINKCYVLEKSKWHTYIGFNNAMIDHGCTGNQTHNGRSGFPRPFCFFASLFIGCERKLRPALSCLIILDIEKTVNERSSPFTFSENRNFFAVTGDAVNIDFTRTDHPVNMNKAGIAALFCYLFFRECCTV